MFVQPVLESLQRSQFHLVVCAVVGLLKHLIEITSAETGQFLLATPRERRADRALHILHATYVHAGRLLL